jgi:hypothetical protein
MYPSYQAAHMAHHPALPPLLQGMGEGMPALDNQQANDLMELLHNHQQPAVVVDGNAADKQEAPPGGEGEGEGHVVDVQVKHTPDELDSGAAQRTRLEAGFTSDAQGIGRRRTRVGMGEGRPGTQLSL